MNDLLPFLNARTDEAEAGATGCMNCGQPIRRETTKTGWTHGDLAMNSDWQGVRCPGKITGAMPRPNPGTARSGGGVMMEVPVGSDREPFPSGLIPAERLAVTVARAQLERGDNPPVNIATVLVMTIDRLTGGPGQAIQINGPRPYALTRDELVTALRSPTVARKLTMLEQRGGVPEDLADAILSALDAKEDDDA